MDNLRKLFFSKKQIDFNPKQYFYIAGTITIPAKKRYNFIDFVDLPRHEQQRQLFNLIQRVDFKHEATHFLDWDFEDTPNRINGLHIHFYMIQNKNDLYNYNLWLDNQNEWLYHCTRLNVIHSVCKFDNLKSEIDIVNWLNYIHKDNELWYFKLTHAHELIMKNWFSSMKKKKEAYLINDLD